MGLVRFRSGYATQDIRRTQVQQAFLKEAAKQCLSASTLPRLGELMRLLSGHVTTDLRAGTVLACGAELLRCDLDAVQTATVQGEGVTVNGGAVDAATTFSHRQWCAGWTDKGTVQPWAISCSRKCNIVI